MDRPFLTGNILLYRVRGGKQWQIKEKNDVNS